MLPSIPAALADEFLARPGAWSLGGARLRPVPPTDTRSFRVAIAFGGGKARAEINLDSRPSREARAAAEELQRAGYEILKVHSVPFHARRALWGPRELVAEARRLEALMCDRDAVRALPSRSPRKPGLPSSATPFAAGAFDHLRRLYGWRPEWVSAGRIGKPAFVHAPRWKAGAWCWAADDGADRIFDLHVQLFSKQHADAVDKKQLPSLTRALRDQLEPLGYAVPRFSGPNRPPFAVLDKKLTSLAHARRQRAVLDSVLFGD